MNIIPLIIIVFVMPLTLLKTYLLSKENDSIREENQELKKRLGR